MYGGTNKLEQNYLCSQNCIRSVQLQCYDIFYVVSHSASTQLNNVVLAFNPPVDEALVCDHFNATNIEGYLSPVNVLNVVYLDYE